MLFTLKHRAYLSPKSPRHPVWSPVRGILAWTGGPFHRPKHWPFLCLPGALDCWARQPSLTQMKTALCWVKWWGVNHLFAGLRFPRKNSKTEIYLSHGKWCAKQHICILKLKTNLHVISVSCALRSGICQSHPLETACAVRTCFCAWKAEKLGPSVFPSLSTLQMPPALLVSYWKHEGNESVMFWKTYLLFSKSHSFSCILCRHFKSILK